MSAVGQLIGREAELQSLLSCLDRAAAGVGQVVFLTGEAGIGKTALATEFLARVEAAGHRTLAGHAYLAEGQAPYAIVADAVRDGLRRHGRTAADPPFTGGFPTATDRVTPTADRVRLFESGYQFFAGLIPARGALVLFLGDLQWADTAAIEFLHYVGRNLHADRLLLVVSYRREELNRQPALPRALGSLRRQGQTTELTLRPLTRAEAGDLARRLFGGSLDAFPDVIDTLYDRARGNPLYLTEILRAVVEAGAIEAIAAGRLPRDPEWGRWLPQSIQDVIQSRLAGLDPVSRHCLDVAAAIGPAIPYAVWQPATDLDVATLSDAIEPLCQLDLIRERPDVPELTFEFSHPLIGDTVYALLNPVRRQLAHTRIADALIARHGANDPEHVTELSFHLARTGDRVRQAKAVGVFQRAGELALAAYANQEAAAHFRLALEHLPAADLPSESRLTALEGLGRALRRTGDLAGAIAAWQEARAGWEVLGQGRRSAALTRRIGQALWQQGDYPAAIAAYAAGLDRLGTDRVVAEAADLYQELAAAWQARGEADRAIGAAEAAAELADRLDAPAAAARAQTTLLLIYAGRGDRARAIEHAERATAEARRAGARGLAWRPHYLLARVALEFGDRTAAERHLAAAIAEAKTIGSPVVTIWPIAGEVALGLLTGDWPAARERADRGIAIGRRSLQVGALAALLLDAGLLRWLLGEPEPGWAAVQEAAALIAARGGVDQNLHGLVLCRRAFLHLIAGEFAPAHALARQLAELVDSRRATPLYLLDRGGLPTLIEAAIELGEPDQAFAWQARLETLAAELDHRPGRAQAARLQGRLALEAKPAEAAFARALAAWEDLGQPYEIARVYQDLGRVRQQFDDRDGALGAFREALDRFAHLGAGRDAERARSALRALGARPARRRSGSSPHGLTDREVQIVGLIATRQSNREIAEALVISPLTVETHVHNILRKLDLPSRALIPVWAAERGLL